MSAKSLELLARSLVADMNKITIRPGKPTDAGVLRRVFEYASHGLSPYLWERSAGPEQDYDSFVQSRMVSKIQDPEQVIQVAEVEGRPVGGILTYRILEPQSLDGLSAMDRSFVEVDNRLFPSVYVNAIAVFPEYRRKGVASALLSRAQYDAALENLPISLSVCDANPGAVSTYEANGYRHVGQVRMEKEDWQGAGKQWLLMVNDTMRAWRRSDQNLGTVSQISAPRSVEVG